MKYNNPGDQKSQKMFAEALIKQGHSVIECDTRENRFKKRPDLFSIKDGVEYVWELKQRMFESTKYGDITITDDKLWQTSFAGRVYFVFFYSDGVGYIVDARSEPDYIEEKFAKSTTRFKDRHKVKKRFICWYPTNPNVKRFTFNPKNIY